MKITKISTITAALSASLLMSAPHMKAADSTPAPTAAPTTPAPAADNNGGGNNGGGRNRGGGPGGNQDWAQRMADMIKTQLKATDDEWAVIQPLLEKVQEKQRAAMGARFGGFGGGGRRGGGPGGNNGGGNNGGNTAGNAPAGTPQDGRTPPPGAAEAQDLRTALESDATTPDQIKAKLAALRESRKKSAAELEQAREDLKKVLTLRQEAVLVSFGILE